MGYNKSMEEHSFLSAIPARYLNMAEEVSYAPGDYIIRAEEPVKFFYVLTRGSAKLVHDDPQKGLLIIDIYHAGDFFGEMEMAGVLTRGRHIIALTRCTVYRFTPAQFDLLWKECGEVSLGILYVHCERLLRSGDDKIYTERAVLREKVFRLIQNNISPRGAFVYTKQVLAEMAGVSIRSLNRSLRELEADKLIEVSGGVIRLHT